MGAGPDDLVDLFRGAAAGVRLVDAALSLARRSTQDEDVQDKLFAARATTSDLLSALLQAQAEISRLQLDNAQLREEAIERNHWRDVRARLQPDASGQCYTLANPVAAVEEGRYCTRCADVDARLVRLRPINAYLYCDQCRLEFCP